MFAVCKHEGFSKEERKMKKQCVLFAGLMLFAGLSAGCISRSRLDFGPLTVAGETQVFNASQDFSFDLGLDKVGFTVGNFGWSVESKFGDCDKLIGFQHSTGNTATVKEALPSLE